MNMMCAIFMHFYLNDFFPILIFGECLIDVWVLLSLKPHNSKNMYYATECLQRILPMSRIFFLANINFCYK